MGLAVNLLSADSLQYTGSVSCTVAGGSCLMQYAANLILSGGLDWQAALATAQVKANQSEPLPHGTSQEAQVILDARAPNTNNISLS